MMKELPKLTREEEREMREAALKGGQVLLPKEALPLWALWLEGQIELQLGDNVEPETISIIYELGNYRQRWKENNNG